MRISTTSYQDILNSVCHALNLNDQVILDIIDSGYYMFQQNHQVLYIDDLYECYFNIVKRSLKHTIDEVSFYNISRRLDDSDNDGLSLLELLTSHNSFSQYLKNYGVTFVYNKSIEMYVNDHKINIPNEYNDKHYLQYKFTDDYSLKGYTFDDQLMNNEKLGILRYGPEFFEYLYEFIDNGEDIIDNYNKQSALYKYEYSVLLKDIYFEDYEELSHQDKQYHLLTMMMLRLYFYKYDRGFVESDELNPVMVIENHQSLSHEYLINKIKLDEQALG